VGGSAAVFGHSSGAILALEAASQGLPITKLAVYEPPFVVVDSRPRLGDDLASRVRELLSPTTVTAPVWGWFKALAHTVPYDLDICGPGNRLPADRLAKIDAPVLAIGGGTSEEWLRAGALAVASAVPDGRYETLERQDHGVLQEPESLRPLLTDFLNRG
jgi:pimeloyl-ACP methyl ester carboxylesterase